MLGRREGRKGGNNGCWLFILDSGQSENIINTYGLA